MKLALEAPAVRTAALFAVSAAALLLKSALAATPASGTLTETSPPFTYTFPPAAVPNSSAAGSGGYTCDANNPCDSFTLTVTLSAAYMTAHPNAVFVIEPATTSGASDIDSQLEDTNHTLLLSVRDNPPHQPTIRYPASAGTKVYVVQIVPGTPHEGGTARVSLDPGPPPVQDADLGGIPPRFENYYPPEGTATDAGEPSVGCNWKSEVVFKNTNVDGTSNNRPNGGQVNYYGGFLDVMLSAQFNDCSSPAAVTWTTPPLITAGAPRALGDPIMFTDSVMGRSWVVQLSPGSGATIDFTDDDGANFTPSTGPFAETDDYDHETLGSGIYSTLVPKPPLASANGRAVYYAGQSPNVKASVLRSDDFGQTFNIKHLMYDGVISGCVSKHGHVKVSPKDGTVYVPPVSCNGHAALARSDDNGETWTIKEATDTLVRGDDDASVGIGADGTLYFGYSSSDNHPRIVVSHDKGDHWSAPIDVGTKISNSTGRVHHIVFPEVVAGDSDRAAFAFIGSEHEGDDQNDPDFPGVWYIYVATTFNGGQSWVTTRATPVDDPIQRGGVCLRGTLCPSNRNLLDFFDAQVDKEGRIVLAGEDGCTSVACKTGVGYGHPGAGDSQAFIVRSNGGGRLFKANDPVEPARPSAPALTGTLNADQTEATLTWSAPDDGGSPVTAYNVYHRVGSSGPYTKIGTTTVTNFTDSNFDRTVENNYHVTAVNSMGESPFCLDFTPAVVAIEKACELPGLTMVSSAHGVTGTSSSGTGQDDLRHVWAAEPGDMPGKLVFTIKVENLNPAPLGNYRWYVYFTTPGTTAGEREFVAMDTVAPGSSAAPRFVYGRATNITTPAANVGSFAIDGTIDTASKFNTDGTITLVVDKSLYGLAAGDTVTNVAASIRQTSNPQNGAGLTVDSGAATVDYTLVGNVLCQAPNHKPTALLIGSSGNIAPGDSVTFTYSGADEDAGDTITTYVLAFDDETFQQFHEPGTVEHVFNAPGEYTVTLTVQDNHGEYSAPSPAATFVVLVGAPGGSASGSRLVGNNVIGGAIPQLTLLLLGALALVRRRVG